MPLATHKETRQKDVLFVGVDPGKKGGIAVIMPNRQVWLVKMPATEHDIFRLFEDIRTCNFGFNVSGKSQISVVIEQVHAMPRQGVSSTFKFGVGYGGLRMAIVGNGLRMVAVSPRKWQGAVGMTTKGKAESQSQFKQRLRGLAQQLYPNSDPTLQTADALLLAEYARLIHK